MKKKKIITIMGLAFGAYLTFCHFKFDTNISENVSNLLNIIQSEELISILDDVDFQNDEDLQQLSENILNWTETIVETNSNINSFQEATLVRVIDGDTIVVNINNEEYTVRLIGVNTHESVHPDSIKNTEAGILSSEYTKNLLMNTQTLYLDKDISETDIHGRLLRYVWLERPINKYNIEEVSKKMLNGILVKEKVAEPVEYEPDTAYADIFEELYE